MDLDMEAFNPVVDVRNRREPRKKKVNAARAPPLCGWETPGCRRERV